MKPATDVLKDVKGFLEGIKAGPTGQVGTHSVFTPQLKTKHVMQLYNDVCDVIPDECSMCSVSRDMKFKYCVECGTALL